MKQILRITLDSSFPAWLPAPSWKHRVAEDVFGWSRSSVELGMNKLRTGILCLNDLSTRHRPRTEDNNPRLLADIREIMEPRCQSESLKWTPESRQ